MHATCPQCGLFHPVTAPCMLLNLPGGAGEEGLRAGTMLAGRYYVTRTLHRGGMSTIYLAEDRKMNGREVALKELRVPSHASEDDVREAEAWFARESALLSVQRHPLIPVFYSVFREDEHSYIVQEYVPGENLEDFVKRQGPVDPSLVVSWGIALCQLLDYLHTLPEPVIFRDLKPANVLLRAMWSAPERRLAVVDFGIARPYEHGTVGTVIGTPGYAPPEQYQGLATPQSDVYSLGATMHRLLTGYDPEQGTPFTFPPVQSLNPSVPRGLAAVVERAVAINPAARFATAHAMHEALSELAPPVRHVRARVRPRSSLFDSTWMAVAAAMIAISLLGRMLAFFAAQPSFGIRPTTNFVQTPFCVTNINGACTDQSGQYVSVPNGVTTITIQAVQGAATANQCPAGPSFSSLGQGIDCAGNPGSVPSSQLGSSASGTMTSTCVLTSCQPMMDGTRFVHHGMH